MSTAPQLKFAGVLPRAKVQAMIKALADCGAFEIDRTDRNYIVKHAKHGEVFRALKNNSRADFYLVRHVSNLFEGA